MTYPENFEIKIGFDKIRELIKKNCLGTPGKYKVELMSFMTDAGLIAEELNKVSEFVTICEFEDAFPVDNYIDVAPMFARTRADGTYLDVHEIFDLRRSLETVKSILQFFDNRKDEQYPALKEFAGKIKVYPFVLERINLIITKHGRIKDNASPELQKIRGKMQELQTSISKKLTSILKKAQAEGWTNEDSSLTIREGRMVIPLNISDKRRIKGLVHDESATGKTAFIEPVEIVELNNEVKEYEYAERREIIKLLTVFTNEIRPYYQELEEVYDFMATVDFIRAKAMLAIQLLAIKPIIENNTLVRWQEARHPLLYLNHRREGKKVVPLDLSLNTEERILLISGPNAGGKSVCLQTTGLLQYMFQSGLLVPVHEQSVFGIFNQIFIDIGDEQSIENDLSTYSSHLLNMKYFLKNSNSSTLVLIDEFGAGTEPMLGGAIAEAILEKLNNKYCFGVITTHYTNLKHFASSTSGILNGAMLFDSNKMEPLFKLDIGKPGSSFAFEIARRIGLQEDILISAKNKVGEEHIDFDKHLREVLRDKRYWETKRVKIRKDEKMLESILEKYNGELENIQAQRKEILKNTKQKSDELLAEVNKRIENTIKAIKEVNAEKEKTKDIRKSFDDYKKNIAFEVAGDDAIIVNKINKLKDREKAKLLNKHLPPSKGKDSENNIQDDMVMKPGDKVKMVSHDATGEILEVNGRSIMVAFGNMVTTVDEKKLIRISNREHKKTIRSSPSPSSFNMGERKLSFKPEIDVRGQRVEEALQNIMHFVDEALMVNASELRILHGKGNGILKQHIREYLKASTPIESVADAHADRGGSGITVVRL